MLANSTERVEAGLDLATAKLAYLVVHVNDLTESAAFYRDQLGLKVLEADENSVKFDAGKVVLSLNLASDYGITLAGRRDDSSDLVFLVDDVNSVREQLEERGVTFVRRRTYEIGLVTDFYDPNGHRLMIYQPSPTALSWPSGDKLREVWGHAGKGSPDLIGPPSGPEPDRKPGQPRGLDGKPLVYLFMFVPNSDDALDFYQGRLGLRAIERVHCCNPACPPEEKGIAKYDVGGMLLTTHHIHRSPVVDDFGKIYSPVSVNPEHTKGIMPVFLVEDIGAVKDSLSRNGIGFTGDVTRSHIGKIARFQAATGHTFCLYEPDISALKWPAGRKIREIQAM